MTTKEKNQFRHTKVWTDFRKSKRESDCKDALTHKKLTSQFNLHHLDLNPDNYKDLSDPDKFLCLNHNSHDCIHFLYTYYRKDPSILDRLKEILDKMVKINQ